MRKALESNGVRVLEDTAARLDTPAGSVWVAGVSDLWTGRVGTSIIPVRFRVPPAVTLLLVESDRTPGPGTIQ